MLEEPSLSALHVADLFRTFCRPSTPTTDADVLLLGRLLEVTKAHLNDALRQLVDDAPCCCLTRRMEHRFPR